MKYDVAKKRTAKIDEICEHAFELVLERGIDGFSLHGLAKKLGVTVGALYRYFPSKQSLFAELELRCLKEIGDSLSRLKLKDQRQGKFGVDTITNIATGYRDHLRLNPAQARLIGGLLATPDVVLEKSAQRRVVDAMFRVLSVPASLIADCQHAGILSQGDEKRRALTLWVSIHGIVQMEKLTSMSDGIIDVDVLVTQIVSDLFEGWRQRTQPLVV